MRTRHRTPSIFNLSMVDVLCCALGCVILLWLLNLREAKQKSLQAGRADEEVATLRGRLTALEAERDEARTHLAELRSQYASAQSQLKETSQDLAVARRRLAAVEAAARDAAGRLRSVQGERDTLSARAAQLDKDLLSLRSAKAAAEEALTMRTRTADDLAAKLKDAEARARTISDDLRTTRERLAGEEARAQGLEKELTKRGETLATRTGELERARKQLDAARLSIEVLQGEKKALANEAERARVAAENRFAGIALTGRRVVILVDKSGSMKRVDTDTLAPDKWPGVAEAVGKVLRSLPDLEQFQVIAFSDDVSYPLGHKGEWIAADRDSAAAARAAVEKTNPEGNTNMYAALEAAFAYRSQGLDTIYLFSDGLPNRGPGLTDEEARTLKETDQAERLGRTIRRKLQTDWNRDAGRGRVRINAIGFFFESPDVGAFLWALARENDGSFVGMSRP
jgi:hypothetical protein